MSFGHILITGGCGFLGQYLSRDLLNAFPELRIQIIDLKANPYPRWDWSGESRLDVRTGIDICQPDSWGDACDGIDMVIHLVGLMDWSPKGRRAMEKINIEGTRAVIDMVTKWCIPGLVTIGSTASLGYNDDRDNPVNEEFQFDWRIAKRIKAYYAITKYQALLITRDHRRRGHSVLVVHPGLMFGAGDLGTTLKVIRSVRAGKTVWAPPGGTNVVDVRDVSRGIVALLKAGLTDGEYILSSWNITYKDMFDTIARQTGDARPKRVLPHFLLPLFYWSMRILEIVNPRTMDLAASGVDSWFRYRYFDSGKATAAIGWRPEFTFADSIQYSLAWLKENDLV